MSDFEDIYTAYFDRVFGFLMKLSKDRDTAEELTQETFFQAYRSLHKYDYSCELFTWLCAIAKNIYLKHLRKMKHACIDIELVRESAVSDPAEQPEIAFQKRVQVENVRYAIKTLPEKYRDIVILRIYGDLPFSQIAKKVGITENSAKVIFFRAKNMLKEALSK